MGVVCADCTDVEKTFHSTSSSFTEAVLAADTLTGICVMLKSSISGVHRTAKAN